MNDRFWELEVDINVVSIYIQHPYDFTVLLLLFLLIFCFICTRSLLKLLQNGVIRGTMLAQRFMGTDRGGQGGIVVNIGSSISINPYTSVPIYSATKAAIVHFTRAFGVNKFFKIKFSFTHFHL